VTETGRAGHYLCSHQTRSHKHSLVPSICSTLLFSTSVIRVLFVSIVYTSNKSFSAISMEVASLVFAVLPLVFPALEYFERTREWHIVAEVQFLQVFDVPWDKGLESKIILSLESPPGKLRISHRHCRHYPLQARGVIGFSSPKISMASRIRNRYMVPLGRAQEAPIHLLSPGYGPSGGINKAHEHGFRARIAC
jgi:hypothetical protein